jgi:hypothetical protein
MSFSSRAIPDQRRCDAFGHRVQVQRHARFPAVAIMREHGLTVYVDQHRSWTGVAGFLALGGRTFAIGPRLRDRLRSSSECRILIVVLSST